jgi:light-independent protochlorophyllide reductase subunit B
MEDHLLDVFGGHDTKEVITKALSTEGDCSWTPEALAELNRIPGFCARESQTQYRKICSQFKNFID